MTEQLPLDIKAQDDEHADRDAERAEYLERLREKLKDPAFRMVEGFPIGEDEDILALSDPPYYTACPNPFLPEIVARWQQERAALREDLALPDDSHDNGNGGQPVYHREPFAADVSEGKSDPIYRAHSYHTKVPHKAVMRYILHYTEPGDVVFDGFCGTGMTGVAAQLCGVRKAVESLGYNVKDDGTVLDREGRGVSSVGTRKAVLVDLSPIATFIARNYNTPANATAFRRKAENILREVEDKCGWMYETLHTDGKGRGRINYTVWSDVFVCPECGTEMVFWDVALDEDAAGVRADWPCPGCGGSLAKTPKKGSGASRVERAWETVYDKALGRTLNWAKKVPVLINYSVGKTRYEKRPALDDLALIRHINEHDIPYWFPTDRMPDGDESRRNDRIGLTHVHHFYSDRSLWTCSALWQKVKESPTMGCALLGGYRVGLKMSSFLPTAWFKKNTGPMKPLTAGTLYIPSLSGEQNWMNIFASRTAAVARQIQAMKGIDDVQVCIETCSASDISASDNSVDYIFTDPPFGSNLMYSELSYLLESWLQVLTNNEPEAIINSTQHKGLAEYLHLMERCFGEYYRVLKPGRWMTVEFHNSQNAVWNTIQEAILRAGFVIADVRTLDKQQGSFKQYTASGTVKQDLVISVYKPRTGFESRFLEQAGSEEGVWDFVRQHLEQVPIVVEQDGTLEVVAEREAYLLYDRMVAFHIQRGFSVPLGAAEFYAGLKQRFPERDRMYFLSHQAAEYDRHRLRAKKVEQLALFVTDEKSAIQWLRRELDSETGSGPQTYQDLQPKFLRELHQARHENLPELSEMLAQSFLKDEQDRWYVPDPARQEDLEQLRERSLLREFGEYAQSKGRLRTFRTEAVRAGFRRAWADRDYRTIVRVAERLPQSVLQEDAGLLMYYDNALMRVEEEPEQGRLL